MIIYLPHLHLRTIELECKLTGHDCPVTCVKYAVNEIISGGRDGTLIVWHTPTARLMRKCLGHSSPVVCLHFDAVKIVSAASSGSLIVHDIATGDVITSLRGHTGKIISLQFDSLRILTASTDNTLRYWYWVSYYSFLSAYSNNAILYICHKSIIII
jgi:WD40 repeat protein